VLRKNAKVEMLRRVPLFAQCSKRELEEIAGLADEIALQPGRELTREGERGSEFFVVVEGDAVVRRNGRKIDSVRSGDFVGEMSLLSGNPRNATVVAQTALRTLVVTRRDFERLLKTSPTIQLKVLKALADRVTE
jgi:CRP-like cAMP-binding protein